MLPAVLALLEAPEVLSFLFASFGAYGAKKFYDSHRENISPFFSSENDFIQIDMNEYSADTATTKSTQSVIPVDFSKNAIKVDENKNDDVVLSDITSVDDYVLRKLQNFNSISNNIESKNIVKNIPLKEEQLDLSFIENSSNLIDVLKNNNVAHINVLSALVNSVTSLGVINSVFSPQLISEIKKLNETLGLIPASLLSVSDAIKSTFSEKTDNLVLNDFVEYIKMNGLEIKNTEIENSLKIVSQAKILEKENYEYMKTPKTYSLSDESLPTLAPRDVIALSEAVKAHLNSQEASITAEDVGFNDYDLDLSSVLQSLFNFEGITKDINKMPKE